VTDAPTTCGTSSSSLSSESDVEGEDEEDEEELSARDAAACGFIRDAGVFFETSASSDEEVDESDDDDDAWRRLRFLLRLRGAVGLAVGIQWY
jgi:hypothetical protein